MNKIEKLFKGKSSSILSVYFTCGFPKLSDTVTIIQELDEAGVEMIEVGIPFSDPLADGPIIQHSSEVALKNGMNIKLLFEQLGSCKFTGEKQPAILLMGYLNPILQFGVEKFCKQASACGVDGLIIPDLPMQEYEEEFKPIVEKYGLRTIFLITPQTTDERIRLIDEHSKGFIYMVASSSTTGIKGSIDNEQEKYFNKVKNMKLKNPLMIGFGISDNETFKKASMFASGAIIGSAFIKAIDSKGDLKSSIHNFIKSIR